MNYIMKMDFKNPDDYLLKYLREVEKLFYLRHYTLWFRIK